MGKPRYSGAQLERLARNHGATEDFIRLGRAIYATATQRSATPAADFLYVQAGHETGWGSWTGGAKKWNPAGIKRADATGDGIYDFEQVATPEAGAVMLINHWCVALLGCPAIGEPHRRAYVARDVYKQKGVYGKINDVRQLGGGIWATDMHYANKLLRYLSELEEM